MHSFLLTALLAASAAGASPPHVPWAAGGASRPEDLVVSLVTFGPGDDITEWFGHSALVVEDTRLHDSRLYNYGEFAFDNKTILKYALTKLTFHVGERGVEGTYKRYAARNRTIHIAELALDPSQRAEVAAFLANNALPENANYVYDHYLDNCATRPRDVIDHAAGGKLKALTKPARLTLRGHTRRNTAVNPFVEAVIDFAENASVDRPITTWDEAFLPEELEKQVHEAGLVAHDRVWFAAKRAPIRQEAPVYAPVMLLLGLLLGGAAVLASKKRVAAALWSLFVAGFLGVFGAVFALLWIVTEHQVAHRNVNLFVASPLTLVAAVLSVALLFGKGERALRTTWLALAALGVVGVVAALIVGQNVWQSFALALPMIFGQAAAFVLRSRHVP